MTGATDTQDNAYFERQWQAHLAHEIQGQVALEERQRQEEAQGYLGEVHLSERAALRARHESERKALLQQHRAQRIALRKSHLR